MDGIPKQKQRVLTQMPDDFEPAPTFVCPLCGKLSYSARDIKEQYCAKCEAYFPFLPLDLS